MNVGVKLLLLLENALKLNLEAIKLTENLNPLHTQVKSYGFIMAYIHWVQRYRFKLTVILKS